MTKFKVGDKVRFKNRNPDTVLEVTAVYENGIVMLKGVEKESWVGACATTAIEMDKPRPKPKQRKLKRMKPEDYWP